MSEQYQPYETDGGWAWATQVAHYPQATPSHLPYAVFLELEGGEFGEPEDTTDHVVWYPTREAAMEALKAARAKAEGDAA